MKRVFIVIIIGAALLGGVFGGLFYWKNLRGVWPVLKSPPQNITKIIESTSTSEINTTYPLVLPQDFSISIFAKDLVGPRVIAQDPQGTLIVSITEEGRVMALPDLNGDHKADKTITVVDKLYKPHGLVFHCSYENCYLYITEANKVMRYKYDTKTFTVNVPVKIMDLPDNGHSMHTLLIYTTLTGDKLLTKIGSSCNACEENDWRRAKILISDLDGKNTRVFASGLRNA
ncbi:hypothetical protein HY967_00595, partial [Candidatus Jorgensenbacteria bacterium]|nr:hypothetical protein [Candidatus Jorgensenbacteria bacterium]